MVDTLMIVGEMCLSLKEVQEDWIVGNHATPDAMFVAYNREPPAHIDAKVIGTNMSRPLWAEPDDTGGWRIPGCTSTVVTTRDISRYILQSVTPTAEHALGLALALHRNLVPASRNPLEDRSKFLAPKMLSRMVAGIYGMGRIGGLLHRYLYPLTNNIYWHDPVQAKSAYPAGSKDREFVLTNSEILFLCCPASPFGRPMGMEEFNQMLPGSLIVNIAQPDLLDWEAVMIALRSGVLRGVAADVYPSYVVDYWARGPKDVADRLLLTPHIAGSTLDARMITEKAVLDVMKERLNG